MSNYSRLAMLLMISGLLACSKESNISKRGPYEVVSNQLKDGPSYSFTRYEISPIVDDSLNHRFNRLSLDFLWEDSLLVYTFENKIHQVNIQSGEHEVVQIPDYEVRNSIISTLPISKDSILTLQLMPPILMINDSQGKIFYKKTLPYFDFKVDNLWWKTMNMALDVGNFNYNLQPLRQLQYDRSKKQVYIPFLPVDYILLDQVENAETIGVFDLERQDWVYGLGAAQGLIKYRGDQNYSKIFDQNYFLVKGDTTYLSYPISHHVFLIDSKSGQLIDEVIASPQDVDPIPSPIKKEVLTSGDFVKMEEWRAGSPFYGELAFHKDLGIYSRVYFHSKSAADGFKGTYWEGRETTLLILDEELKLIQEIDLDPKVFQLWRFLPTSDGFLVSEMNLQKDLENSDVIKLGYTARYRLELDGKESGI